nr:zf-HC2 domain-containing protein [Maliibacterium massiliense]
MCEQAWEWMNLALDGALQDEQRALLEAHLAQCAACREKFALLQSMRQGLRAWEEMAPPEALLAHVMARLPRQKQARKRRAALWAGGAVAACLVLFVAGAMLQRFAHGMKNASSADMVTGNAAQGAAISQQAAASAETAMPAGAAQEDQSAPAMQKNAALLAHLEQAFGALQVEDSLHDDSTIKVLVPQQSIQAACAYLEEQGYAVSAQDAPEPEVLERTVKDVDKGKSEDGAPSGVEAWKLLHIVPAT